jgi:hypothetical protein
MTVSGLLANRALWWERLGAFAGQGALPSLLRGVVWFWCADILFTGFASAFAYSMFGVQGVLGYLFLTQFAIIAGYLANMAVLHRFQVQPWKAYRAGSACIFVGLLAAGLLSSELAMLGAMAAIGGAGRGIAFSSRVWLELHHTDAALRERYLGLGEATGALLRLVVPVVAGIMLAQATGPGQADNFHPLFIWAGALGTVGTLLFFGTPLVSVPPGPLNLKQAFSSGTIWRTAPFFVVDGAGLALRTALFVAGAMALVGSAAKYGLVEAGASCFAIGLLVWRARHATPDPSLPRLRNNLLLLGFGWLMLLLALKYVVLLPLFVAAYALGTPLVTMVKTGLSLKAMALPGISTQDAMSSRMLLFCFGRMLVLGISWLLTASASAALSKGHLAILVGVALALLPLEYYYAKRLHQT